MGELSASTVCQYARPVSCSSSATNVKSGVSVGFAHKEKIFWYVLRVSYGRIAKAKELLETAGLETYAPLRYKQVTLQGKKKLVTDFLLPAFIFVHASLIQIETLLHDVKSTEAHSLVSIYYDHTTYRSDAPDRNPPLTIADEVMANFIKLTSIHNPHIIPVTSANIEFKLGDQVVVTEGEFAGVYGRVSRLAGQQRVVVALFSGCLVASAYVPRGAMKFIV